MIPHSSDWRSRLLSLRPGWRMFCDIVTPVSRPATSVLRIESAPIPAEREPVIELVKRRPDANVCRPALMNRAMMKNASLSKSS